MRAPSSFKNELAAYRKRLIKERADYPRLAAVLRILDRWRDHGDAETIWKTIKEKLPAEDMSTATGFAVAFIDLFLQHWEKATETNELIPEIPGIEAKTKGRIKRHLQEKKYGDLWRETALLDDGLSRRAQLLGREGDGRTIFMRGWSEKFQELCGQPLDEIVASLAEIAFDEHVTPAMARRARRKQE